MTHMRIALDGYNLAMPNGTGIATYAYTLASTLQQMGHRTEGLFGLEVGQRQETRELLFFEHFGHGHRLTEQELQRRVALTTATNWLPRRPKPIPISQNIERRGFGYRLPAFDALWSSPYLFETAYARFKYFGQFLTVSLPEPPDIMHWTYPLPIRVAGTKNVYTLHDLVPLRLPQATLDDKRYYHRLVKQCVNVADQICTVSEASQDDILAHFPAAEGKITNTYQSSPVPTEVLASNPAEDSAIIKGMFGLKDKGYLLFFGAVDPKKNLGRIIDAYLTSNVATPLVIVSARDWGMNENAGMLSDGDKVYGRSMRNRIIRLEYLPRTTLFRLIRTAKAVLFPSLYEGFGLPALEAIQLGTPVISSNVSSLPEVVGNAGLLVDPYKVHEIAAAIRAIDSDSDLYARLLDNAPAQGQKFSDAAYQLRLAALYSKVKNCADSPPEFSGRREIANAL
jgi:glycosyltransferase involved in cell wall biosynthesis